MNIRELLLHRRFLTILMFAVIPFGKVCLDCAVPMLLPLTLPPSEHMSVTRKIDCSVGDTKVFRAHSHLDASCRVSDAPNALKHSGTDLPQVSAPHAISIVPMDDFHDAIRDTGLLANVGPPEERLLTGTTIKRE